MSPLFSEHLSLKWQISAKNLFSYFYMLFNLIQKDNEQLLQVILYTYQVQIFLMSCTEMYVIYSYT